MLPDLVVLGKASALQFGKDKFSVHANFELAAVRGNQDQFLNPRFEVGDQFVGQTDRLRFVVSNRAVHNFDFHICSVLFPDDLFNEGTCPLRWL